MTKLVLTVQNETKAAHPKAVFVCFFLLFYYMGVLCLAI